MHGCSSASRLVVNAEVDSMGGVVEGGVGVGTKTSPRRAAIEKVQAELRQEYDVREERRRELEFLEKGGNPLDFKFGNAASVSVQSTSLTDQHPEIFLASEAKGSFAFTASPHGDSVESSGVPGAHSACEPNSADNLMLFDGENDSVEGDRNSVQPSKNNITPTENSFPLDGSQNAKEIGDSAGFGRSRKAYIRRNRSRTSRDGARSSSTDVLLARGGHGSSLPSCHGLRDSMGLVSDANNQKIQKNSLNGDSKPTSSDVVTACKTAQLDSQLDMELDGVKAVESTNDQGKDVPAKGGSEVNALKTLQDQEHNPESVSDTQKATVDKDFEETESLKRREEVSVSVGIEVEPCMLVTKVENQASSGQENGFSTAKGDDKSAPNDGQNNTTELGVKVLDSESSCTQTSLSLDGNNDSEMCTNQRNTDSNGIVKEHTSVLEDKPPTEGEQRSKETKEIKANDSCTFINDECNSGQGSHQENGFISKSQEEINGNVSGLQDNVKNQNQTEVNDQAIVERMEADGCGGSETERKSSILLGENLNSKDENVCTDSSLVKLPDTASPAEVSTAPLEGQTSSDIKMKANKIDEDSILEEARIIEAKRKRIAELSVATLPVDFRRKSQWDYVLEEMAWLANDFAQERLWKITAAAQICHRVASASRLRFHEQNNCWEHKKVARILARAVMEFWHSVEETSKQQEMQCPRKGSLALQEYAVRFLKHNNSDISHGQAEAPVTPDRVSDLGIMDMSLDDYLTEEDIFYIVPPFATENYRHSIESHVVKYEKTGSSIQEEVETSACDAGADFGSQDNAYEEDEGEISTYDTSVAFDGSKSSRFSQKRWKNSTKAYSGRTFEVVADSQFMQCMENKVGSQQPVLGKRPASSLNVSFPTKRVRTSNRQRISPFSAGTSACVQVPHKTDASSGDTNSFQDDHRTLHGGSHVPNNLEVDSVADFEKSLQFDSAEVSKSKKKKKAKLLGSAYDQRWQVDSNFQNEQFQRDHSKKRSEGHQLESNGSSGLFGQHVAKKQKIMRPSLDNSFDTAAPFGGSAPSPVASQISNPNRLIKYFGGRERGRKNKVLKMPASQSGSGSPWTVFEDQALVVLVHDLGPNWELVSDAINSTLQFKCIFRNPKECKERHKLVLDRPTGDGADSADDSGSSQIYESTLPGIPKGSARQLFQKLQGPMEEDTLKSHFEKIIMIGQKLHCRRKQNECHDPKQLQQPHGSHMLALTQVSPNNLNGGPVLTPLDLCDATASSPDLLPLGFQGPHNGGLTISSSGTMAPMLNASGGNSAVPGSSSMIIGNNLPSSSGPISASVRDGRYTMPRSASLSIDEQQRMQQYNQILSSRNIPQSNVPSPGAVSGNDRGIRVLSGGSAIGITGGINRNLPITRPGFQGIASSSMLNPGSMISSGMVVPSPVNMHTGAGSGQGNSLRPRDALHMMRPSQNQDPQRQMMAPELQMQASQGNNQGVPPFGALSSSFPNQTASPPVSSYPLHHQQSHGMSPQQPHVSSPHHPHLQGTNHATNPQHQAYAIRLAKERQLQQRLLQQQQQQQQQQFASSNSMMPHVQPPAQLPISPPSQTSSQVTTPTVSLSPLTSASPMTVMPQHQQKHQVLPHGLARSAPSGSSGLSNQVGKQRQRQPQQQQYQQAGRHHPQQRQQPQSQQQAKVLKGVGRGNMMMHQNISMDPSLLNGLSTNPGNQSAEKGDQTMHLLQGQGLYAGSTMNSVQSGKSLVPHSSSQSQPHQKMYSGQASKHLQQMPSHSDNANQGHISPVASGLPLSTGHQSVSPMTMASSSHLQPQLQPHQKLVNQSLPNVQRVLQNRHVNSEPSSKLQGRESQADQIPTTNSSQMGTIGTMPQASNDATGVTQVGSSAGGPQWRVSESSYDSVASNTATNLSSVGTPPSNSASNEPSSQAGHGLGQRQSSGNLPPVGHDVSTQWQQQQPSPVQQPPSPVSQQQQQASPQQLPPQSHSQQQAQLVGNGSMFVRPTDSRLE